MRIVSTFKTYPQIILLVTQLGTVLLYPSLNDTLTGRLALAFVGVLIVSAAVSVVWASPAGNILGSLLLAFPALAFAIMEAIFPATDWIITTNSIFHATFYFYVSYALLSSLFEDNIVTRDELYGIGSTFTVVIWAFAYLFVFTNQIWVGAFPEIPLDNGFFRALFTSFAVLTAVGLSDIIPGNDAGRSVMMLADFAGVMYMAIVVARLVGLTVFNSTNFNEKR